MSKWPTTFSRVYVFQMRNGLKVHGENAKQKRSRRVPGKHTRHDIYAICLTLMFVCLIWSLSLKPANSNRRVLTA